MITYEKVGPETLLSRIDSQRMNQSEALLLYAHGGLQILILTDGSQHYTYDIACGRPTSLIFKETLGPVIDVSGAEMHRQLKHNHYAFPGLTFFRGGDLTNPHQLEHAIQQGYERIVAYRNNLTSDVHPLIKP